MSTIETALIIAKPPVKFNESEVLVHNFPACQRRFFHMVRLVLTDCGEFRQIVRADRGGCGQVVHGLISFMEFHERPRAGCPAARKTLTLRLLHGLIRKREFFEHWVRGGATGGSDLSAECQEAEEGARFPQKDEHKERTQSAARPPPQGTESADPVSERTTDRGLFFHRLLKVHPHELSEAGDSF